MISKRRWASTQEKEQKKAEKDKDKDTKLVSRASMLSSTDNFLVISLMLFCFVLALVVSTVSADMLVYDEGNVYSCPVDYMKDTLQK